MILLLYYRLNCKFLLYAFSYYYKQQIFNSSSIVCIGIMYQNLGRLMGRTYEETVQILVKILKNGDVLEIKFILNTILIIFYFDNSRKFVLKFIQH